MQNWLADVAETVRAEGVIYAPIDDSRVPFIDVARIDERHPAVIYGSVDDPLRSHRLGDVSQPVLHEGVGAQDGPLETRAQQGLLHGPVLLGDESFTRIARRPVPASNGPVVTSVATAGSLLRRCLGAAPAGQGCVL